MIVTFYSFKGGVGRSMAMANIARWFQLRGLNVVMVDWDLEAPGLETFFSRDPEILRSWRDRVGLMDLLLLYKQDYPAIPFPTPKSEASPDERWAEITADAVHLRGLLPPLKFSLIDIPAPTTATGAGRLRMLTAGWREGARFSSYANAVQGFDWNDFYASYHGHSYFEWLRSSLDDPEIADVVLVDSRTGVTEMGGVSTRQLADVVVVLSAPNRQNIEGSIQITQSFARPELLEQRGNRPIRVIMVPSRVDVSASDVKREFEDEFRKRANQFMPEEIKKLERDFWDLRIPYVNKFAFQERLTIGEPDGDPDLDSAYRSISAHIAWLAADTTRTKSVMVDEFERVFGRERVRRALDFGAQFDQRWRDISSELQDDVEELLLRLVEVRGTSTETDRSRVVLERQFQGAFTDAIAAAERARLVVRTGVGSDGMPALRLAEPEYVTKSVLAKWINDGREFLAWRQRLRVFLDDWIRKGRDPGSLLQGSALVEAAEMASNAERNELLDDEREFVEASVSATRITTAETALAQQAQSPSGSFARSAAPPAAVPVAQSATTDYAAPSPAIAPLTAKSSSRMWMFAVAAVVVIAAVLYGLFRGGGPAPTPNTTNPVTDSLIAGQQHAAKGDLPSAIAAYTAALRGDSMSVDARRLRATAEAASGRTDRALLDLDTAVKIAPTNSKLRAQRAQLRFNLGDAKGALDDLGRVPADSMDSPTLQLRADLYNAQGQDSAALGAYAAVVQRGDTAAGQLGRGRVLERLGRNKEALQAYRAATNAASDPSIVTFAQARIRVLAPGATPMPPPASRVYLQVLAASDAGLAAPIDSSLKQVGLHLERGTNGKAYEVVDSAKTIGEVRYFTAADEALAKRVQTAVEGALAANGIYQRLTPQFVRLSTQTSTGMRRSGLVEIWLPPLSEPSKAQQQPRPYKPSGSLM